MAKKDFKQKQEFSFRINDEINGYDTVRIVGEGGEGKVVSLYEAKKIAAENEVDLIEVNTKVTPPIMKLALYDKFIYEMKKRAKKNLKQEVKLKEIQLKPNIASNDLNTKVNKAKGFINDGDKVKVTFTMKGRELTRREESKKSLYEFIVAMEDVAVMESQIRDEGNRSVVILKKKKG